MRLPAAVLSLALLAAAASSSATDGRFLTVDEVSVGDRCVGRTVFSGTDVVEFGVEIIGVVRGVAPGSDLIIGRAEGDLLEHSGILEGMSGSPVYRDGRLVGAISSTWSFSKEPIAGITPIGEMLPALELASGDGLGEREGAPAGGRYGLAMLPAGERELSSAARLAEAAAVIREHDTDADRPARGRSVSSADDERPAPVVFSGRELTQLAAPLVVSGAERGYLAAVARLLGPSVAPVQGGGAARAGGVVLADADGRLEPGSAVCVQFVGGDVSWSAVGTVTHVDGDRLVAFGHPLFAAGPIEMPLAPAYVHAVMPMQSVSFKYASGGTPVGTMTQDRSRAVAGVVGPVPRPLPVRVRIRGEEGQAEYSFDVVRQRPYSAIFSGLALGGAVSSAVKTAGPATVSVSVRMDTGADAVEYRDVFHTQEPAMRVAGELSLLLSVLTENSFEEVDLVAVEMDVDVTEGESWSVIERVAADRSVYRPGEEVALRVAVRERRGGTVERTLTLRLPQAVPDGRLTVMVGGAAAFHQWEADRLGAGRVPRSYAQLLDLIRRARPGNTVIAQLLSDLPGFSLSGREMSRVPGRAGLAMASGAGSGSVDPAAFSLLSEDQLTVDGYVLGFHEFAIEVRAD